MGIIKVEWEIGKSLGDRLIISFVYYIFRYFSKIFRNYKKFRSKSKIPKFTDIDLNNRFYPFIFFFVIAPILFALLFSKYINEGIMTLLGIIYILFISISFGIFFIYLIYRILIDAIVSGICLIRSFVSTTYLSLKIVTRIMKKILSLILQRF